MAGVAPLMVVLMAADVSHLRLLRADLAWGPYVDAQATLGTRLRGQYDSPATLRHHADTQPVAHSTERGPTTPPPLDNGVAMECHARGQGPPAGARDHLRGPGGTMPVYHVRRPRGAWLVAGSSGLHGDPPRAVEPGATPCHAHAAAVGGVNLALACQWGARRQVAAPAPRDVDQAMVRHVPAAHPRHDRGWILPAAAYAAVYWLACLVV